MRDILNYINESNTTFEVDIQMNKEELNNFISKCKKLGFQTKKSKNRYSDTLIITGDKQKIKTFFKKNNICDLEYSELD